MSNKPVLQPEERLNLARRLTELSDRALSVTEKPRDYIAIESGTGPNKNVISVNKREDKVSFYIRSSDLLARLKGAGFEPDKVEPTQKFLEDRYRFWNLKIEDLNKHPDLFADLVRESISVVEARRSRKSV